MDGDELCRMQKNGTKYADVETMAYTVEHDEPTDDVHRWDLDY